MRSPRASNEARQRLFTKMSGELQRKIGSKAQKLGGNAVIGYQQVLDIEGDSGVVVRGIGTVVSISAKNHEVTNRPQIFKQLSTPSPSKNEKLSKYENSYTSLPSLGGFNTSFASTEFGHSEINHSKDELLFSTMKQHTAGFVKRYSSTVCTRAVKLLPSPDDANTRNIWWNDLRQEIADHCSSIGCNAVLGYTETTSVCDDVILMSAQGTAAVVDKDFQQYDIYDDCNVFNCDEDQYSQDNRNFSRSLGQEGDDAKLFQIPTYLLNCVPSSAPQPSPLNPDYLVPDIVLATVDLPPNLQTVGRCCLIQARFCRTKKKNSGEACAATITDILPFIEYELHRQLCFKLKLRGLNAIFGLKSSISIGENLLIGIATGTGVKLAALPSSQTSDLKTSVVNTHNLTRQSNLEEFSSLCKKRLKTEIRRNLMIKKIQKESAPHQKTNLMTKSLEAVSVDDDDDDVMMLLEDHPPDEKITLTTLESWPNHQSSHLTLSQTFQMFRRIRYDDDSNTTDLNAALRKSCEDLLTSLTFRVTKSHNDVTNLSSIRFNVVLTDDQFQIWIVGSAFTPQMIQQAPRQKEISSPQSISKRVRSVSDEGRTSVRFPTISAGSSFSLIHRLRRSNTIVAMMKRPFSENLNQLKLNNLASSSLVELIPASDVPNIYRYLGSINLFIIRETTAVRGSEEELPDTEPHPSACNWFVTRAIFEAQTIARAHTNAMGGNALIAYSCTSAILKQNFAKNEAQLLMSISGDVVFMDFNQYGVK